MRKKFYHGGTKCYNMVTCYHVGRNVVMGVEMLYVDEMFLYGW
jgi:hypothetical protein